MISPDVMRVLGAVPAWWARRARLAGLPPSWCDWRLALPAPPLDLVPRADPTLVIASGYELGEAYVCALPVRDRAAHGRHYTPKPLAEALWREIDGAGDHRGGSTVTDPASGAGALLLPPLRQAVAAIRDRRAPGALRSISDRFSGVDTDPYAVWLGNAILGSELLPLWASAPEADREPLPPLLRVGDGLDVEPESAGVVVMNPPFGRAAVDGESRKRWSESLYGHANWYGIFLHAAVERARSGGVVAAVLPTSFLGGAYHQRLRALLAEQAPLVRLRLIDDRAGVFASGVLQEACLAVFEKGAARTTVTCTSSASTGGSRASTSAAWRYRSRPRISHGCSHDPPVIVRWYRQRSDIGIV